MSNSKFQNPRTFRCPVQYCTTKSEHRKALYFIPEHPKRRQDWLDACGISHSKTKEIAICWKHFRFEDFENEAGFGRLKKNVFPTQFPPTFVSRSHLDLGHVAVVDNNPELPPLVPIEDLPKDPPEEVIIHNEFSNPHDYFTPNKASTTGSAEKGNEWLISNYNHGRD